MSDFIPSIHQQRIRDFILANEAQRGVPRRNLIINALAGSGKSTTCDWCMSMLTQRGLSIAYAAYNAATVAKMKENRSNKDVAIYTAHGFALSALTGRFRGIQKNDRKLWQHVNKLNITSERADVIKLTTLLKEYAVGLEDCNIGENVYNRAIDIAIDYGFNQGLTDDAVDYLVNDAIDLLEASRNDTSCYDFTDMIYMCLFYKITPRQFDYIFIDEGQDTNVARRLFYLSMRKPWGAIIVVGDRHQAIYRFNGADANAMDNFKLALNAEELDLPICYRCDKAIITEAQKIVPEIEHFEQNMLGLVRAVDYKEFITKFVVVLGENDAILCRNNAPLVRLFFALVRNDIPCRFEGRDIGAALVKLIDKLGSSSLNELRLDLEAWSKDEAKKLEEAGKHYLIDQIIDKVECLLYIAEKSVDILDLREALAYLFIKAGEERRDCVTLSSVHKSKGMEWDRVFILGRYQFMPSARSVRPEDKQQEQNLIYVATTRAKHELVFINNVPK